MMLRIASILVPLACVLVGGFGCSGQPEVQEVDLNQLSPDQLVFELIKQGDTPNLEKVLNDSPELAQVRGSANATPLHAAASYGDRAAAELLLQHGADPQAADEFGQTPLDAAKTEGHEDIVALLEK